MPLSILLRRKKVIAPLKDQFFYIFNDVWCRSEFEFVLRALGGVEEIKIDLFSLYVIPNRNNLLEMVERCSLNSAREYVREYNSKHKSKTTK